MEDKQTQALKRLTKKLSALRATLRKDERELLDQLILGEVALAEVLPHGSSVSGGGGDAPLRAMLSLNAANGAYAVMAGDSG